MVRIRNRPDVASGRLKKSSAKVTLPVHRWGLCYNAEVQLAGCGGAALASWAMAAAVDSSN